MRTLGIVRFRTIHPQGRKAMKRSIRHWSCLNPQAVSDGSRAQSFNCIDAARADILELSRALMWVFDRTDVDGGMTEDECKNTAEEIGKILADMPSVAARYVPNEWDASVGLTGTVLDTSESAPQEPDAE